MTDKVTGSIQWPSMPKSISGATARFLLCMEGAISNFLERQVVSLNGDLSVGGTIFEYGKYRHCASIAAYGAVGDGVRNDTYAIQAAIDSVHSLGGGAVFIPVGTYMTGALTLYSDTILIGTGTASVLKANVAGIVMLTASGKSNVCIANLLLNGGGQTTNIYSGLANNTGIYYDNVEHCSVINVRIKNFGVVYQADPGTDANYGGFGIIVKAVGGATRNVLIDNCLIENVAGGGYSKGDCIYVGGSNIDTGITTKNVVISNCRLTTAGRNVVSVARGGSTSIAEDVRVLNCWIEKSALAGIDCEPAYNTVIDGCTFSSCGNDQTYYDPVTTYGATYRLCAGVATGNSDKNITIAKSHFTGCHYGISYGAGINVSISGCRLDNSVVSDLHRGGAQHPAPFKVIDTVCESAGTVSLLYRTTGPDTFFQNVDFSGTVQVPLSHGSVFDSCVFRKGFQFSGTSSDRILWKNCYFLDWAGPGIGFASTSYAVYDCTVQSCRFIGAGNLTYGIEMNYNSSYRWAVRDNEFYNPVTAGIYHSNTNAAQVFTHITGNLFSTCPSGIVTVKGLNGVTVSGNSFLNVSGWCIDCGGISSGYDMTHTRISGNYAGASVTGGIRLAVTSGSWDYCDILSNDMSLAGTPFTLPAGNVNGTISLSGAPSSSHDYAAGTTAWTMTALEADADCFIVTNASGAADAVFPAARLGKNFTVYNNSGQAITFKVSGQTGAASTNAKYSVWTMSATDCVLVYEQP